VKRLAAEQFLDAVLALTSTWPDPDAAAMKVDGRGQGGQLGAIAPALASASRPPPVAGRPPLTKANWLWSSPQAREGVPPQTIYLRRQWSLDARPARGLATITADNSFELFINGKSVGKSDNWNTPLQLDVTDALAAGKNIIGLKAANGGTSPNPAGAIGDIVALSAEGKPVATLSTDDAWQVSDAEVAGWLKADFDASKWKGASVLGDASVAPWNVAAIVSQGLTAAAVNTQLPPGFRVRAALMPLDPLQSALGRPNREQVVSARDPAATMLQALELTNGTLLGQYISRGAAYWHKQGTADTRKIIDQIYLTALSRPPADAERGLAIEIIGSPPTMEGLEDLLWTVCMLPEFQLAP
jgi:hypothetical protein